MNFHNLHQQSAPLLICNVWDVASAKVAQQLGFKAIGTSSGAMAEMLGHQDGEGMSFQELFYLVKRIRRCVDLPLTVDLEAGYSRDVNEIVDHIRQLQSIGVVGINLEDSLVESERRLLDPKSFAQIISQIHQAFSSPIHRPFLNVRTDPFLLGMSHPVSETIQRAQLYQQAGADGLFVPCVEQEEDIKAILAAIDLPLNVMCMPHLPDFESLRKLGVKRISMGNFVFRAQQQYLAQTFSHLQTSQSFDSLFAG
ncbi:MAG: isocitrate lyase/phosphoenolpyruvate mutase family protein [Bacteroidota bacterium]